MNYVEMDFDTGDYLQSWFMNHLESDIKITNLLRFNEMRLLWHGTHIWSGYHWLYQSDKIGDFLFEGICTLKLLN